MHELIKNGAKVDMRGKGGRTALHMTAYHGLSDNVKTVRELIKIGASVSCQDTAGMTALHWACYKG
jgi:ankyrin repeat protein